jgi:hypothetical protein
MQPLSDLDAYRRLSAMAEELDRMSGLAESLVAGTALNTAALTLRGVASALYQHCLSEDGEAS